MHTVFIGIGSNIQAEDNIRKAAGEISRICRIIAFSSHIITPPLKNRRETDYINAVWKIETKLSMDSLKDQLWKIENFLGRRRTEDKYAAREIDMDILVFDGNIVDETVIRRDFIYGPLLETGPEIYIPGFKDIRKKLVKYKGKYQQSGLKKELEKEHLNEPEKS